MSTNEKANGEHAVAQGIGKPSNPKDRAATARLDLTLFPDTAIAYGALAMTEGDLKYGGYNYRPAGVCSSVYIAACRRHLAKWYNGEDADATTTVSHLANAIACIAVLIDSLESGNLNDDRPPKVNVAGLMDKMQATVKHLQQLYPNGPGRFRQTNAEYRTAGDKYLAKEWFISGNNVCDPLSYSKSNEDRPTGQARPADELKTYYRATELLGEKILEVGREVPYGISNQKDSTKGVS